MSVARIDIDGARRLIALGAQLVEVLPAQEYRELHLPGAINLPLKQLDRTSARQLDRDRDVVVYCWDALCDLSPRAAARLDTLGFARVHDYAAGKADWLAHGLPAEGVHADRATAGTLARRDAAICALDTSAAEARRAIAGSPYGLGLVLGADGVLLGRIRQSSLQSLADDDPIESVMEPGPSTLRPHLTLDELGRRLKSSGVGSFVVTRPDGTLVGVARQDDLPRTARVQ